MAELGRGRAEKMCFLECKVQGIRDDTMVFAQVTGRLNLLLTEVGSSVGGTGEEDDQFKYSV